MPVEVICITFIAMVAVIMVNIVCAVDHKKAEMESLKWQHIYYDLILTTKKKFWERLGAYEAPEGNKLYLDLNGIRLVVDNGELEGWYIP